MSLHGAIVQLARAEIVYKSVSGCVVLIRLHHEDKILENNGRNLSRAAENGTAGKKVARWLHNDYVRMNYGLRNRTGQTHSELYIGLTTCYI